MDAGFLSRVGGGGRGCNLEKRNSVWIPVPEGAGSGRAPGRGRDMAIGGVGVRARGRQPGWGPERSVSG